MIKKVKVYSQVIDCSCEVYRYMIILLFASCKNFKLQKNDNIWYFKKSYMVNLKNVWLKMKLEEFVVEEVIWKI